MTSAERRSVPLACLAIALGSRGLVAQCPDGTPPPCRPAAVAVPSRGPVDENLIAVFPFRISGAAGDASLREGAMDLLALALDEQAGLRVVSSRTLLARARNFTDASPVSDAAAIARSLGAGLMILGNGVVVGTQLRARAELHDVVRNRAVTSVEARGTSADPGPVIDSLAAALARVRLTAGGGTRRSLQEFASTSPAALRAYLAAERLGRQGRWKDAADTLVLAIHLDSTFGLAYYRLSVAGRYAIMPSLTDRDPILSALRFQDHLPRRQLELLRSVYATQRGGQREALTQADATAAAYPDDPEAAFEQGEAYFHVGLALGGPTGPALAAFQRAMALDSSMLEPYNHTIELLLLGGDTTTATRLAARGLALAPDAEVQIASSVAMRIIHGEDPAVAARDAYRLGYVGITRTKSEIERMMTNDPARALTTVERMLAVVGPDAPSNEQQSGGLDRAVLLAARGQFAGAAAGLPARGVDSPLSQSTLRLTIQALSGRAAGERAGAVPPGPGGVPYLAAVGWNALLAHDSATWLDASARLRQAPAPSDLYGAVLADCLDGLAALRHGDSTRARTVMAAAARVRSFSNNSELGWHCVLQLARLEQAAGARADALLHLNVANYFNGIPLERADMEELRALISTQQGDTATAVRSYRNFIGLWQNADPELQPRVAAARTALAALEHR